VSRRAWIRVLVALTLLLGVNYVVWRWLHSVNWQAWWIAVPLVLAETYALVDAFLFGTTMWQIKIRGDPPTPSEGLTVDVLITTYNEPVPLVEMTTRAALAIVGTHRTWILDDGTRPEMRAAAEALGVGYLERSDDWTNRPRHAKAGNLNNALFATDGEFLLILDADQVPDRLILQRTLGWFEDPKVALVQTPQWFSNVPSSDPMGSQAPLFYGPIQQGKDGWNAAFFCGSNAVLRRDALMQLGVVGYVREVEAAVRDALRTADAVLGKARRRAGEYGPTVVAAIDGLRRAATDARRELRAGAVLSEVTYRFQAAVDEASRTVVGGDVEAIRADLEAIKALPMEVDDELGELVIDEAALARLADREWSPLGAIESVSALLQRVDVDCGHEAQPIMPLATISVTEDMATCMRLHALGWRSVYHNEVLAVGLAPEDLGSMLQQRLRWAQGTIQVMLRENPLTKRGLSVGQRLMYFATMWSYLSGFAAVVFIAAPVVYLVFNVRPVVAYNVDFLVRFIPYVVLNQVLFFVVGYGVKTWRGHQYSLALFPLWIRACATAFANVVFGKPLGFVVTPKTRPGRAGFPWRLVAPQLIAVVVLVIAAVVGLIRLVVGATDSVAGTVVNMVWIGYDLLLLSVIVEAAIFQPAETQPAAADAKGETEWMSPPT
jgi:cellulose synthase/poly-beta-1,6-N-acetylglucosamine synthase-like glycosyltransferase